MEYKNILLGFHYSIMVIIDHKNNTFNGLKASDHILLTCWLLLLEEYGVTFEYLPGKKKIMIALSRLDIDSLKIQDSRGRSVNTSLRIRKQQHQKYQMNNPNAYCLDLQRIQGTRIKRKGLSPNSLLNTAY
jgi:hypothetical protein